MSTEERKPTRDEAIAAAAGNYANWLKAWKVKPEGITDVEWKIYQNWDPQKIDPRIRDKVEAALGWKPDDVDAAREIAEQFLGAVKIAEKGHVPEENLRRYRAIVRLARQLDSLGGQASGIGEYDSANILWAESSKLREHANELRVDISREEDNEHHD